MKKKVRWIWGILELIVIIYVVLVISILLCKNKYGYTQMGKYTLASVDSINAKVTKNLKKGDLLVTYYSKKIKKGDIVYYYAVYDEKYIIQSDTVVSVEKNKYNSIYSFDQDGFLTVSSDRVLGKKKVIFHGLGSVVNVLESRLGFILLIILPIIIVFLHQIYELFVLFKSDSKKH